MDRPPANALDLELLRDLVAVIHRVELDPPRALVLTGREGFFSAGADLKAVPSYGPEEQRQGGLVLALCADLGVASSAGRYGLTEIKVGVPYPQAAIGVMRAELAPHAARVLALGNQLVDAGECLRLGVFDEIVQPQGVLPRAIELARELATFPSSTYARTKHDLRGRTLELLRAAAADDPMLVQWVS